MATFVGAGAAANGFSADLTPTLHASSQAGDFALLALHVNNDLLTAPTVTGWTNRLRFSNGSGNDRAILVYSRVLTGSGDAPTVPRQASGAICQCAAWRGVDIDDPINVQSTSGTFTLSTVNIPVTAVTPTAERGVVVVIGAKTINWTSVDTLSGDGLTWAEIGDPDDNGAAPCGLVWDYALFTSTPTLTDKTFAVNGSVAEEASGVMLVLQDGAPTGAVAATLQPATAALIGEQPHEAAITASLQPATAVAAAAQASVLASIAGGLQPATAALTAETPLIGEIEASLQPATAALGATLDPDGTITATLQALTAALTSRFHIPATAAPPAGFATRAGPPPAGQTRRRGAPPSGSWW